MKISTNNMKIFRSGIYLLCMWIFVCLLLSFVIPFTYAQQWCDEKFSELSEENLSKIFSQSINAGETPQQARNRIWDFVISQYPIGKRLTQLNGQECREISGINLSLDYHIDGKDYKIPPRQIGNMDAYLYYIVDLFLD